MDAPQNIQTSNEQLTPSLDLTIPCFETLKKQANHFLANDTATSNEFETITALFRQALPYFHHTPGHKKDYRALCHLAGSMYLQASKQLVSNRSMEAQDRRLEKIAYEHYFLESKENGGGSSILQVLKRNTRYFEQSIKTGTVDEQCFAEIKKCVSMADDLYFTQTDGIDYSIEQNRFVARLIPLLDLLRTVSHTSPLNDYIKPLDTLVKEISKKVVYQLISNKRSGGATSELIYKLGEHNEPDINQIISYVFLLNWFNKKESILRDGKMPLTPHHFYQTKKNFRLGQPFEMAWQYMLYYEEANHSPCLLQYPFKNITFTQAYEYYNNKKGPTPLWLTYFIDQLSISESMFPAQPEDALSKLIAVGENILINTETTQLNSALTHAVNYAKGHNKYAPVFSGQEISDDLCEGMLAFHLSEHYDSLANSSANQEPPHIHPTPKQQAHTYLEYAANKGFPKAAIILVHTIWRDHLDNPRSFFTETPKGSPAHQIETYLEKIRFENVTYSLSRSNVSNFITETVYYGRYLYAFGEALLSKLTNIKETGQVQNNQFKVFAELIANSVAVILENHTYADLLKEDKQKLTEALFGITNTYA